MRGIKKQFTLFVLALFLPVAIHAQQDSLRYDIDELGSQENLSNLDFSNGITQDIQYNPDTEEYEIVTKYGDLVLNEETLSIEEYRAYILEQNVEQYWRERVNFDMDKARGVNEPDLSQYIDTTTTPVFDVDPFGGFDVILGYRVQNVENPTLPIRQRRNGNLDFDANIQMGITGSIADRLNFDATFNTETNFNFNQNQFKVGYLGKEDDILQEISFGNVSLPLRSSLIQGNQSLLGVKTTLQFGRLTATSVLSQQESQQQGLVLEGTAQRQNFEIKADEYEENRHYFLAHFFRDQYNDNLNTLPALNTPFNITRLQVWVTNRSFQTTNIRQFAAFTDLGEPDRIFSPFVTPTGLTGNDADNNANNLHQTIIDAGNTARSIQTAPSFFASIGFEETTDFEIIQGRKLEPSEFTFNRDLGYISLNRTLAPDEVLGVSFEYTDIDGNVRRVGEFSENLGLDPDDSNNQLLVLKLLKPKAPRTDLPTWDLMMKNIYPLGAFQVDQQDFRLDVYYNDPGEGLARYIPALDQPNVADDPLIRVLQLDRFNASTIRQSDGVFDFLPGYTIDPRFGRLIFPVLEPFGDHLRNNVLNADNAEIFAFDELYDLTKTQAQLFPEFNRYTITGTYKSESRDEISLGAFNIPPGSVTVRAGGRLLVENADYTVDYNLGRIKVLNTALVQSGVPLNVQFENNLQFGFQSKRLAGTRLDYYVNDKLGLGATVMNLRERPFSDKVNFGSDPINNTVLGFDVNYQTESQWLTRAVDKIPFIDTKEQSSVNIQAEVARFIPGHANQIGDGETGRVFLDDFEGASSIYDLKFPPQNWFLASTPQRFPEATLINDLRYGFNRALFSWYNIDPLLNSTNNRSDRPDDITVQDRSDVYARQVLEREVFPNIINEQRVTLPLNTLDVTYYPERRGPYNFNVEDLNADGTMDNPRDHWGGIMREVNVTDFQAANVEFLEFWLMDPFINTTDRPNNANNSGKLVFNLGNISEDVLRDGQQFFENGLPEPGQAPNLDETTWGNVPTVLNINNAFSADQAALEAQDVGYDGLDNDEELAFYNDYLQSVATVFGTGSQAFQAAELDPAADDFHHFLGEDYDAADLNIIDRYQFFTNSHGNSSSIIDNLGTTAANSTNVPENEDVNRDNTLERTEAYFEYEIDLSPGELEVGRNFITSKVVADIELDNGQNTTVDWYQFRVPINQPTTVVNNFSGIQSIRFVRMYLTEFDQEVTARFARLQLLRNQWRRYEFEFDTRNIPADPDVNFNVFPVNIEENANKQPIPYVLPPGVQREQIQGAANSFLRNEQSLAMNICELPDGDARAIFRLLDVDMRLYEQLNMFVHAESIPGELQVDDDDFELVMRIGSDFTENFYEYRQPLSISNFGASDPFSIWPEENNVAVNIPEWIDLKVQRNADPTASRTDIFYNEDGSLGVVGTPDLGRASFIMIAVENIEDDKLSKCTEVWVNELSLSGLNEDAGYAALARADFKLADFGNVSFSGNLHTAGYGSLEQTVQSRFRDDLTEFDVSGSFNLDKFLPSSSTVKIPVLATYSKLKSTPQFSPYETDLLTEDLPPGEVELLEDDVEIKSINLTNVRKERKQNSERQPKVYDVENFNVSYSYTERNIRSAVISNETERVHYGALGYNYSPNPKPIRPFFGLIKEQKYLQWAKDFNINLVPSRLSFNTDMTNQFRESAFRDIQEPSESLESFFFRDWVWNRNYSLSWDLTNSISIDFDASNRSRIDQPSVRTFTQAQRDSVRNNLKTLGRNTLYNQSADVNYQVPFDKIPILDFIRLDANYGTTYQWLSAPQEFNSTTSQVELNSLGSAIQNTRGIRLNTTLDFNKLYNKSGFLSQYTGEATRSRPGNRSRQRPDPNQPPSQDPVEPSAEEGNSSGGEGLGFIIKPLLSIKRISAQYSDERGTLVPGFTQSPDALGVSFGSALAPGLDFAFGAQPGTEFLDESAEAGLLSTDTDFSFLYNQSRTRQFRADASLQPFQDFSIELSFDYSKTDDFNELFRNTGSLANPTFEHINPYESGNYAISFITLRTLFSQKGADGIPQVFRDFENNRTEASELLQEINPSSVGVFQDNEDFRFGYGPFAQEVLIPSFIAAYTGQEVRDVELDPFNTLPLPNWSLNFSGLTRIPAIAKNFSSIRLTHAYNGSFNINQFNTNLAFEGPDDYFLPTAIDELSDNFFSFFFIPQITISESFAPLAGLDFTMTNGLNARFNYSRSRTLGLSLLDFQTSESNSTSFTIGAGYRTNNITLPIRLFGGSKTLENQIDFRLDYSLQDDESINFRLDQNTVLPTRGARTVSIFPTIDYVLNDRINLQTFFERRRSEPRTRNSFPITNTRGGMRLSYSFGR